MDFGKVQKNDNGDNVGRDKIINNVLPTEKYTPPHELTRKLRNQFSHFIGREKELDALKEKLEENNSVLLINGIGGVGKSSLAAAFLERHKDDYAHVGFVEVLEDIKSTLYTKLLVALQLDSYTNIEQNFDEVILKLKALDGNTLLVIDDVQKPQEQTDAIETLLELNFHNVKILFTSRRKLTSVTNYSLDKLGQEDAEKLFESLAHIKVANKDVKYILVHIDNHAYFVEHIAKNIHSDEDVIAIIQKMKTNAFSQIVYTDDEDGEEHLFSDNLHVLFGLQHSQMSEAYVLLLKQLVVLPSIEISYERLYDLLDVKKEKLNFLVKSGWLIESESGYKLHQVTKEYILAYHMPTLKEIALPFESITNALIHANSSDAIEKKYEDMLYAKGCVTILDKQKETNKTMGNFYGNLGNIYYAIGDYTTALEYLIKSLVIREEIGDKAGEGITLNNISQIYKAQGDYTTALEYLTKSLVIREEIGDKAGEGTTLNNMATASHAKGDYTTALEYLIKSLAIQEEIGDKAGEGTTLNNISQIYDAQGDYTTALEYLTKSLAIREEIGDKAGMCATMINMGYIVWGAEEGEKALEYWMKAYSIASSIGAAQALEALSALGEQLASALSMEYSEDFWDRVKEKIST